MADIITHCTVTTVPHHTVTSGLSQPSEPEPSGERESSVSKLQHITIAGYGERIGERKARRSV